MGFATRAEVFGWVATSRFFTSGTPFAATVNNTRRDTRRISPDRTMFWAFVAWAAQREDAAGTHDRLFDHAARSAIREDALRHFALTDAFEQTRRSRAVRNTGFNGTLVGAWTGLTGRWREVKVIMGEGGWSRGCRGGGS